MFFFAWIRTTLGMALYFLAAFCLLYSFRARITFRSSGSNDEQMFEIN